MAILSWLLGSELGRKIAIGGAIAIGLLLAVWRIYAAGQSAEKAKQAQAALENLRKRMQSDDEISRLPAAARRERISEWVSDDK
jgi:type VI protein secretion system component VasK